MKILSALMLLFLMGVFVMPPILVWAQADPVTIVVPDNYSTIASAIQHASSGDTIFVKSGLYHESLVVDKSLLVMGENSTNTTIIGVGGAGSSVFTVSANNVEISGFTIQSRSYSSPSDYSLGIDVAADNCSITGNNITNTYIGIYVGGSGNLCGGKSSVIISRNNITANVEDGILFYGDSSNVISENNITGNNATGIALDGYSNIISKNNISGNKGGIGLASSNSVIFGNNITGNRDWGLYFETYNNIVSNNYIAASTWGIYLSPIFAPSNNKFYHNDLINNDVQVYTGSAYNMQVWDDGYPSGGNYWSHYLAKYPNATKLDDSGIWDTPFVLGANNTDRYPLISPFSILATDSPPPLPAIPCQNGAFWLFNTVEPNSTTPDTLGQNPAVLAPVTENVTSPPVPSLVKGRFGNALSFDFPHYVWAAESPSLNIAEDLTIDVWINVKALSARV
jgi:parallel beta-helix repeat protein